MFFPNAPLPTGDPMIHFLHNACSIGLGGIVLALGMWALYDDVNAAEKEKEHPTGRGYAGGIRQDFQILGIGVLLFLTGIYPVAIALLAGAAWVLFKIVCLLILVLGALGYGVWRLAYVIFRGAQLALSKDRPLNGTITD